MNATKSPSQPVAGGVGSPRATGLRENLEAIVIAILLALLIRQFAMEAFVIPTGSMAPTLLGAHLDLTCTNCGKEQPVTANTLRKRYVEGRCEGCGVHNRKRVPEDASIRPEGLVGRCRKCARSVRLKATWMGGAGKSVTATCSSCRKNFTRRPENGKWPLGDISRGDRILVNKFVYRFRDPKRYEVAVFKFPERPQEENYIKRLVGLPGETLDIRNGDIYADGKITRKPPELQESLWLPVYESRYVEKDRGGERGPAWAQKSGHWRPNNERTQFKGKAQEGETAWLAFNRPITDVSCYNDSPRTRNGLHAVRDVRVAFGAKLEGGETLALLASLVFGDDVLTAECRVAENQIVLFRSGRKLASADCQLSAGVPIELAFWRADEQVCVSVNGDQVLLRPLGPTPDGVGDSTSHSTVRIGVRGGDAIIKEPAVFRDVYYRTELPPPYQTVSFPYKIPKDSYFALGDNSSNSTDSRKWGIVPASHIAGRAFMVFWPAVPGDFAIRRIR
jgi:signal peptidase I